MIGGSGPRMLGLAARYADIWNRDFDVWNPDVTPYSEEDVAPGNHESTPRAFRKGAIQQR